MSTGDPEIVREAWLSGLILRDSGESGGGIVPRVGAGREASEAELIIGGAEHVVGTVRVHEDRICVQVAGPGESPFDVTVARRRDGAELDDDFESRGPGIVAPHDGVDDVRVARE
jgi:hypothetical protein